MPTESSTPVLTSSERNFIDYKLLKIPKSQLLSDIFLRDGMFDFTIYQYPDGVDVNMLDFYKAGADQHTTLYVSQDSLNQTTKYIGEWNKDKREGRGIQVILQKLAGDQT